MNRVNKELTKLQEQGFLCFNLDHQGFIRALKASKGLWPMRGMIHFGGSKLNRGHWAIEELNQGRVVRIVGDHALIY